MVEQFCPRWTPAGRVLYVGDAGTAVPLFDETGFRLGVTLDKHGKLPDLVVLHRRSQLARTHGGGVIARSGRREAHGELRAAVLDGSAGLVFVFFPTRRRCASTWPTSPGRPKSGAPTPHLIHFNGERFLGPYDTEP